MKIIALIPVKNEAWILPTYISGVKNIADEIIALDDGSSDRSIEILKKSGAIVKKLNTKTGAFIPMSVKRNFLLDIGRKRKGTHFVFLDVDEVPTYPFRKHGRDILKKLKPGQKILMRWYLLWKSCLKYRDDSNVLSRQIGAFIFADLPGSSFSENYLSESRTPNIIDKQSSFELQEQYGILHFQFLFWEQVQIKQAWYRCLELIHQPKKFNKINYLYSPSLDDRNVKLKDIPKNWLKGLDLPKKPNLLGSELKIKEIFIWFDKYGIEFFEPLQIWHIPILREEFLKRTGRTPRNYLLSWHSYLLAEETYRMIKNNLYLFKKVCHKIKKSI